MQTDLRPAPVEYIKLQKPAVCAGKCPEHPCAIVCPTGVFEWTGKGLRIDQEKCVECGACELACPHGNLHWTLPPGGFGVVYHW